MFSALLYMLSANFMQRVCLMFLWAFSDAVDVWCWWHICQSFSFSCC